MNTRRILSQPTVLTCDDCRMVFRAENLTPYTMTMRNWFCPACGSNSITINNSHEDDRWYNMAISFGLPQRESSVQFIKQLYDIWDPIEFRLFKDFVLSIVNEVQQEAGGAA